MPPVLDYHATMKVIAVIELFAIHVQDLRAQPELFGESLRYRIIAGGVRAEEYLLALALAPILRGRRRTRWRSWT